MSPDEAWVKVGPARVSKGWRVRLHPVRRADAMDMFLDGRSARVEGIYRDVDDEAYVAVSLDDEASGDLHAGYGRFLYFYPDEIEPVEQPPSQERRT